MTRLLIYSGPCRLFCSLFSSASISLPDRQSQKETITVLDKSYERDDKSKIPDRIQRQLTRKLHLTRGSPIYLVAQRIKDYFHKNFRNRFSSPLYTYVDHLEPVVTTWQNFDSLLIPSTHPSRSNKETYYVNSDYVLRSHTSAHQTDLIRSGIDNFLVVGDVYRRDVIDKTHFTCFHQMEGVSLFTEDDILKMCDHTQRSIKLFENGNRNDHKQSCHTSDVSLIMQNHLKVVLEKLVRSLFGEDLECRWVNAFFPFTHPSLELEIFHGGQWIEMLGCGIIEQELLRATGVDYKIGWAFGIGLERLAMKLYQIPDIRVFWSTNSKLIEQFNTEDLYAPIVYQHVSRFPESINDLSMWLPDSSSDGSSNLEPSDFYELVREVAGDIVEEVKLKDNFVHPHTGKRSHCYRITYRLMHRKLSQNEVSKLHKCIADNAEKLFGVTVRR